MIYKLNFDMKGALRELVRTTHMNSHSVVRRNLVTYRVVIGKAV